MSEPAIQIMRKRIKNMYIRIHPDKSITVSVPVSTSNDKIHEFLSLYRPWIENALLNIPDTSGHTYADGEPHTILGKERTLRLFAGSRNQCILSDDAIYMIRRNHAVNPEKLFEKEMKRYLEEILAGYISHWSPVMKVTPASFSIRHMRTRWGSCNRKTGVLHFSLDLVSKPLPCIESVVVHELNHLLEAGHNKRFYALMSQWIPDHKELRMELNRARREFY